MQVHFADKLSNKWLYWQIVTSTRRKTWNKWYIFYEKVKKLNVPRHFPDDSDLIVIIKKIRYWIHTHTNGQTDWRTYTQSLVLLFFINQNDLPIFLIVFLNVLWVWVGDRCIQLFLCTILSFTYIRKMIFIRFFSIPLYTAAWNIVLDQQLQLAYISGFLYVISLMNLKIFLKTSSESINIVFLYVLTVFKYVHTVFWEK